MSAILEDLDVSASPATPSTRWQRLEQVVDNGEPRRISADRGSYSLGQTMTMAIDIPRDAFRNIVNISDQDEMTLLFPNQYHRENRVSPGGQPFHGFHEPLHCPLG